MSSVLSPRLEKTVELKLGRRSHLLYQQYVDLIDKLDIQKSSHSLAIYYSLSNVGWVKWQNEANYRGNYIDDQNQLVTSANWQRKSFNSSTTDYCTVLICYHHLLCTGRLFSTLKDPQKKKKKRKSQNWYRCDSNNSRHFKYATRSDVWRHRHLYDLEREKCNLATPVSKYVGIWNTQGMNWYCNSIYRKDGFNLALWYKLTGELIYSM